MGPTVRVVLWNTEWASLRSRRGVAIRAEIESVDPDLVCLTEAAPDVAPAGGHLLTPGDAPRVRGCKDGEKVLLWSRWPWSEVERVLPGVVGGRFVHGRTGPGAGLAVTGVCIPWQDSRVRWSTVKRRKWEDHLEFIHGLEAREATPPDASAILLGDFNQRLPRWWQPVHVFERLSRFLGDRTVPTAGWEAPREALIDHVALSGGLSGRVERIWPKKFDGLRVSDHVGVMVEVTLLRP